MTHNGLFDARHYEDALSVQEAELSMMRRFGTAEQHILDVQGNIANTYEFFGRLTYTPGYVKLLGREHRETLVQQLRVIAKSYGA